MKILLQFPEGLKQNALELSKKYEDEGHDVFLSASPCYGACDIALDEARWIKADKIIHFGHNKFVKNKLEIPVEYVPYHIDLELHYLDTVIKKLKQYKNIALVTTVQHSHQIEKIRDYFAFHGINIFTETGYWATQHGQILGCDTFSVKKLESKIDAVLYIGDGMFHPLGIDSEKPIIVFNPRTKELKTINDEIEKIKKRRKASLIRALSAKKFAVLLSTKVGQFNIQQAEWAKKELTKRGREAVILVANELEPITLNNFRSFECYINTACPRIIDDTEEYGKPILSMDLLKEMFKIIDENNENNKNNKKNSNEIKSYNF